MWSDLRVRLSDLVAGPLVWVRALYPVAAWLALVAWLAWVGGLATDFGHASGLGNAWPAALVGWWTVLLVVRRVEARWGLALGASAVAAGLTVHAWGSRPGDGAGLVKVLVVVGVLALVYDVRVGAGQRRRRADDRARLAVLPVLARLRVRIEAPVRVAGRVMRGGALGHYGASQRAGGAAVFGSAAAGLLLPLLLVAAYFAVWFAAGSLAGRVIALGWVEGLAALLCAIAGVQVGRVAGWPLLAGVRLSRSALPPSRSSFSAGDAVRDGQIVDRAPMPAYGDTAGLFAWLREQGVPSYDSRGRGGAFVGRVLYPHMNGCMEAGEWYQAPYNLLAIGTAGAGKTTKLLTPNIVAHAGPVVAVSSALDVATETARMRALVGECSFWDPSGESTPPRDCVEIAWSPLIAISTPDDASAAATLLIDAMKQQGGSGGGAEQHFADRAAEILSALFYAGVLHGRRISSVYKWMSTGPVDGGWDEPMALLEDARLLILGPDVDPASVDVLLPEQIFLNTLKKEKAALESGHGAGETHSALTTAMRMLKPYSTERARAHADTATFNPAGWERTAWGFPTIYIRTQAGEHAKRFGPLIALFVSDLVKARRDAGENSSRPPLRMVFDELAAVPIPSLGSILSNDRKYRIQVLAATQSDSQLSEHPLYGASVIHGFDVKVLFPRSGTADLHQQVENASARVRVWMASTGESEAGNDFKNAVKNALDPLHGVVGSTATSGSSQSFERALDRAEVVGGLGEDEVRVIEGFRALTRTVEEVDVASGAIVKAELPVKVAVGALWEPGSIWADVMRWAEASMELQGREDTTADFLTPEDFVAEVHAGS